MLVAASAVASPTPASASTKARPSCDRLGGTTLAANSQLRLFRQKLTKAELKGYKSDVTGVRFRACSYRTRHVATLRVSEEYGQNAEPTTYTWAINGEYAAVSTSEAGSDDGTDRSAGLSSETLVIWNARTRRTTKPYTGGPVGLRFSELVVSPKGTVGAIGNPYRFGLVEDERHGPLTDSYVVVYEPATKGSPSNGIFRYAATAPINTLTGLAISGSRLIWTDGTGLQQAPIR